MSANNRYLSKVGSKGELFPPSKLRKLLKIKPGSKVLYYIHNNKLIVEPVLDMKEILRTNKKLIKISAKEFENDRKKMSNEVEN